MPSIAGNPQKLEKAKEDCPLEPLEGAQPNGHLDFELPAFQNRERINWCCLKPPSLWLLVTAVPGN